MTSKMAKKKKALLELVAVVNVSSWLGYNYAISSNDGVSLGIAGAYLLFLTPCVVKMSVDNAFK